MSYWKSIGGKWLPAEEKEIPAWNDDTQTWEGFACMERSGEGEWALYANKGSDRWIVDWEDTSVLIENPQEVIDLVFKLRMSSLSEELRPYSLAMTVARVQADLPSASLAIDRQRREEARRTRERRAAREKQDSD